MKKSINGFFGSHLLPCISCSCPKKWVRLSPLKFYNFSLQNLALYQRILFCRESWRFLYFCCWIFPGNFLPWCPDILIWSPIRKPNPHVFQKTRWEPVTLGAKNRSGLYLSLQLDINFSKRRRPEKMRCRWRKRSWLDPGRLIWRTVNKILIALWHAVWVPIRFFRRENF